MRELAIDWTRCRGHGLCAALLPHMIVLDEWGYPVLRRVRARDEEELLGLRRAVSVCPALALRLEPVAEV